VGGGGVSSLPRYALDTPPTRIQNDKHSFFLKKNQHASKTNIAAASIYRERRIGRVT
jgi:hypothetical protein